MKTAEFEVGDILPLVMIMAVAGIGIAYVLQLQSDIKSDVAENECEARTDGFTVYNASNGKCGNGTEEIYPTGSTYNASTNVMEASTKFTSKFGLIATVI